jgi:glycosyltransferase involved in cell wall biosynthesis
MAVPATEAAAGTARAASLRGHSSIRGVEARFRIIPIDGDAGPFLSALDVFVYMSKLEGLGSAILLAMAHALPVLASPVGGIPEIVHHNKTGLLAAPGLEPSLSEAAMQLVESPELRRQLGSAAREFVLAHATCDRMTTQTIAVYEELLRHRVSSSERVHPD